MARHFESISIEDLKQKIDKVEYIYEAVQGDLKVNFDFENLSTSSKDFGPESLMGYHTTENGLTYCGMCAGGDWEMPVFFLVYWDGKKLRAYIPKEGNPWNSITKEAYGNDDEKDLEDVKKRYPDLIDDEDDFSMDSLDFDEDLIRKDFENRIHPKNRN